MTEKLDPWLPNLEEFSMDNVPFNVVDPSRLPDRTRIAFDAYIAGSAAPHPVFVYSHDYARFCMLVRQGRLPL